MLEKLETVVVIILKICVKISLILHLKIYRQQNNYVLGLMGTQFKFTSSNIRNILIPRTISLRK